MKADSQSSKIDFHDFESGSEAVVLLREAAGRVALSIAVRENGDLDLLLDPADALRIARAIMAASGAGSDGSLQSM